MANPRGHAWRKLREQVLANATHCALCGLPLVPDAPPRTRWSSSVDHIIPLAAGGDVLPSLAGLRPAHYGCNSKRKDKLYQRPAAKKKSRGAGRQSRNW